MGRYIKQLDSRLSIPKHTKESELTEQQKLFKIGAGIKNEQISLLRRAKLSSGSLSPEKLPREGGASNNALLLHQLSGGDLNKFIKKTSRINSTERGAIPASQKDIEALQILASFDSTKLIHQKSQLDREKTKEYIESRKYVDRLKMLPGEQRDRLIGTIHKG